MLGAAHNSDLANARKCGLMTGFFPRPTEYGPHQKRDYAADQELGRGRDGSRGHGRETRVLRDLTRGRKVPFTAKIQWRAGFRVVHGGRVRPSDGHSFRNRRNTMPTDLPEIEHVLQTYFDGLYEGDTSKLGRVFHDVAHLFSSEDGKLADLSREQWFEMVRGRQSAQSRDLPRRDWVVQIDRSGPSTAFAKVHCQIPPRYFTDYLDSGEADGRLEDRVEDLPYRGSVNAAAGAGGTKMLDYDYIICRRRVRRFGAGQPAVGAKRQQGAAAGSRAGYAAWQSPGGGARFLSRHRLSQSEFTWNKLKVTTEVISHNNPDAPRPPLRTYEQARILGGGSSINGQLANRGAPTDYDEWHARGATGWNWDNVLPYLQEGRARHGFRRSVARQGGPHPGAPHLSRSVAGTCQSGGGGIQASRLGIHRRSERRVGGWVFPDHHLQRL